MLIEDLNFYLFVFNKIVYLYLMTQNTQSFSFNIDKLLLFLNNKSKW